MSVNDVFDVEIEGNHAVRWDTLDVDLRRKHISRALSVMGRFN